MEDADLKKYRYEIRNEFITEYRNFHDEYDDLLYYLGLDVEDNLADIVRDKIWEIAEIFDEIDYNYFFQTEIGNIIINMLSEMLIDEEEILSEIDEKINVSYFINWLYYFEKINKKGNWVFEYRRLCEYFRNISINNIIDDIIVNFQKMISITDLSDEIKSLFRDDFKNEINFLIDNKKINEEYKKMLIK